MPTQTINWSLQHRVDAAANWTANNPTLLAGQLGIETDNLTTNPKFKIGDGSTAWTGLPYVGAGPVGNFVPYSGATADVDLGAFLFSSKSLRVTGTSGNGDIHLRHQSSDATATGQTTSLFADSNGDIKWKNDGNYYTTLKTSSNTSDRLYIYPDADGVLALTSNIGTWGSLNYPTWSIGTPFVKMTAVGTFALDTNTYLTGNQSITISGDASGSGSTSISLTLTTVNSNIGTYNNVTVNAKGLVTSASNVSYLTSVGTGTTNELTYWSGTNTLGSLSTSTYPSLTELSYVKGVTSSIQTQINGKQASATNLTSLSGLNFVSASFVKMTGAGTFTLDTNTYLTSSTGVTTVNGSSGAITNVALTTGKLSQFASTTSAELAGVISDETGSGALVFGTSPTFTTSIITPLITGVTGALSFSNAVQSSGSVTDYTFTKANHTGQTASTAKQGVLFTLGSRQWATGAITTQKEFELTSPTYSFVGASTITNAYSLYVNVPTAGTNATITNNYALGANGSFSFSDGTRSLNYTLAANSILNNTGDTSSQIKTTSGTRTINIQSYAGDTNYIDSAGSTLRIRTTDSNTIQLWTNNISRWTISATGELTPTGTGTFSTTQSTSGAVGAFIYSPANNTGQTASTEINGCLYNSYTRTWAAGNITTQREQYIKTVTYAFASPSTITNAYGAYFEAPTAGGNAIITNNYSAGFSGNINILSGSLFNSGTKVLGTRATGWTSPTGSLTRTGFATSTATVTQLAETLAALITDLTTHGLIGA